MKKHALFFALSVLFGLLSSVQLGCSDLGIEPGGPGIIIPGVGVDGIKLGDSKDAVETKLGSPTSRGWALGLYREWRTCSYLEGQHAGLDFLFIDNSSSYGPLDAVLIGGEYSGSTDRGIRIGSRREIVQQLYGTPLRSVFNSISPDDGFVADFYCISGRQWEIHYQDSVLTSMSIGFFLPTPQDTAYSCN